MGRFIALALAVVLAGCARHAPRDSTRDAARFWVVNAARDHGFDAAEAAIAAGMDEAAANEILGAHDLPQSARHAGGKVCKVLPYPGGRHPRIGFLEGAVNPMRGTKASVFAPWDAHAFAVIDVPEAIFSDQGLLFLAHTHVPTLWDERGVKIENLDWTRRADGALSFERTLPNQVAFGATVIPAKDGADMEMWLRNGGKKPLRNLRTQVCVMLKGMPGFTQQTNANKRLEPPPVAEAVSTDGRGLHILTAWRGTGRCWGNKDVPCIHADPVFPDCAPGQTVRVEGALVFAAEGNAAAARARLLQRLGAGTTP